MNEGCNSKLGQILQHCKNFVIQEKLQLTSAIFQTTNLLFRITLLLMAKIYIVFQIWR